MSTSICRGPFFMFNSLRSEVIACFVHIGGIVDYHCLNLLYIKLMLFFKLIFRIAEVDKDTEGPFTNKEDANSFLLSREKRWFVSSVRTTPSEECREGCYLEELHETYNNYEKSVSPYNCSLMFCLFVCLFVCLSSFACFLP